MVNVYLYRRERERMQLTLVFESGNIEEKGGGGVTTVVGYMLKLSMYKWCMSAYIIVNGMLCSPEMLSGIHSQARATRKTDVIVKEVPLLYQGRDGICLGGAEQESTNNFTYSDIVMAIGFMKVVAIGSCGASL